MIKTLAIMLIIAFLIIFFLILALIGQLDDLCEYEKKIKRAIEYIENHQLVFELYSIEEIIKWFDTYYKNVLYILKGEDKE